MIVELTDTIDTDSLDEIFTLEFVSKRFSASDPVD